jgi:endonuclease YncB( thermonuclease family)
VRGRGALLFIGVVTLGLACGAAWQRWGSQPADSGPSSAIEWNAVQAVPTRAPDAEDVVWEKRTNSTAVIASDSEAIQSPEMPNVYRGDGDTGAWTQTGLPRASSARNDIYVYDGDTFGMGTRDIRIANIDAPEVHDYGCASEFQLGTRATERLRALLASGTPKLSGNGIDRYGRDLRTVQINGKDVGQAMIGAGLARNYDGKQRQGWC